MLRERIVKDNLLLARKIFNIMEGNSDITDKINDSRHIDNHPGTMNFRQRLSEAQRIHERNMLLASRLDTVQPYYKVTDLTIAKPVKKKVVHKSHNPKKSKFARELGLVLKADRVGNAGDMTHRSAGSAEYFNAYKFSPVGDGQAQSQSARKPEYGADGTEPESRSENQRTRPNNVLLEYTKIQDGRVLDVAVLKEPFRDRYAIFGIDVDDGQRYELRLTSDEVSSILDGDMLVTSVDNVEVWMALLNKVNLQKVGYFARLPFSAEEVDNINSKENGSGNTSPAGKPRAKPLKTEESENEEYGEEILHHYTLNTGAADVATTPPMSPNTAAAVNAAAGKTLVPVAPTASRPSGDRPVSRVASGGAVVTSAAGAVRGRHVKSSGQGQAGGGALRSGDDPIDDTILSLFADAGLGVEVDRVDVVTPGFMDNATSATVTLVQANADFPDAPEGMEQVDSDSAKVSTPYCVPWSKLSSYLLPPTLMVYVFRTSQLTELITRKKKVPQRKLRQQSRYGLINAECHIHSRSLKVCNDIYISKLYFAEGTEVWREQPRSLAEGSCGAAAQHRVRAAGRGGEQTYTLGGGGGGGSQCTSWCTCTPRGGQGRLCGPACEGKRECGSKSCTQGFGFRQQACPCQDS